MLRWCACCFLDWSDLWQGRRSVVLSMSCCKNAILFLEHFFVAVAPQWHHDFEALVQTKMMIRVSYGLAMMTRYILTIGSK